MSWANMLSNKEWVSTTDGDARIAKLKDGRTHMGYKAEHVVDLESGAIVSVTLHPADQGDTKTVEQSQDDARVKLSALTDSAVPEWEELPEVIGDKGYHSRTVLKALTGIFRSRISEPGGMVVCTGTETQRRVMRCMPTAGSLILRREKPCCGRGRSV